LDFSSIEMTFNSEGWFGNTKVLDDVTDRLKPDCIIEIGSWKGASAIYMAERLRKLNPNSAVICIDTWLGSTEHWLNAENREEMMMLNGRPRLYEQFMFNMVHKGLAQNIVPMPMPSRQAAALLTHSGMKFPMIHIDGAHDYNTVSGDLEEFWPLLLSGGVIVGDDHTMAFPGVIQAVREFGETERGGINRFYTEGSKYVFQKT